MKDLPATLNHFFYSLTLEWDEENQSWYNVLIESLASLSKQQNHPHSSRAGTCSVCCRTLALSRIQR